jgi:hypothetical protein
MKTVLSCRRLMPLALLGALVACSSVKTLDTGAGKNAVPVTMERTVKQVDIHLGPTAKKVDAKRGSVFFAPGLRTAIQNELQAKQLLDARATQTLDVEVENFRVRPVMMSANLGAFSGTDYFIGTVTVKVAGGEALQKFHVKISHGAGGHFSRYNSVSVGPDRMAWLYQEFAKDIAAQLSGEH